MLEKQTILKDCVSSIVTCDRVKKLKPDAEPILKCIEELNVNTNNACYIGDAYNDMCAASSAGVDFIAIERYNNCAFNTEMKVRDLTEIINNFDNR